MFKSKRDVSLKSTPLPPDMKKSAETHKGGKPYILAIAHQVEENRQMLAGQGKAPKQFV